MSENPTDNKDHQDLEELQEEQLDDNDKLLGGKPPLRTLLYLSIGPLLSQVFTSVYSIVDSIYVAMALGDEGVEVFGAIFVVEFVALAFAQFLSSGLSTRISYLLGHRTSDEIPQIIIDFYRIALILGVCIPAVVLPITKPVVKLFGASDKLADNCLEYMIPHTGFCVFNILFLVNCGIVQATGHSVQYAIAQFAAFVLNIGLFDPIFLLGLHTPVWGASTATILGQGITGLVLMFFVFRGTFGVKPELKLFLKKFSPETKSSLKMGISALIENFSSSLPTVLVQYFINSAATASGVYDNVIKVWAINTKLYQFISGLNIGFSQGLLPCASYAYGAERFNRLFKLTNHAMWLTSAASLLCSIVIIIIPRQIASIWSNDPVFLDYAEGMVPIWYWSSVSLGIQYVSPVMLQAMKRVMKATMVSVITLLLPLPIFSIILYFTGDGKTNPRRMMFVYTINDCFSVLVDVLFLIEPYRLIWKAEPTEKGADESANIESTKDEQADSENMDRQEPRPIAEL